MRKIENKTWTEKVPNDKGELEDQKADLAGALGALLVQNRDKLPKGIDQFRIFHQIQHAFDDAATTGTIELEEAPYLLIKGIVEKEVPPNWAAKPEIYEAIEAFLKAEPEKKGG